MKKIDRRTFICSGSCMVASAFCHLSVPELAVSFTSGDISGRIIKNDAPEKLWKWSHEGFLYKKLKNKNVMCQVCPNHCILSLNDRSVCRSRVNKGGVLYSLCYGNPCSVNVDPVEKKPLYHFKPESRVFSLATTGCNFRCLNCQNWEISQSKPEDVRHYDLFPEGVIKESLKSRSTAIAYTYSEATTYFEYMIDIAKLAKENHIANLWISNGYINEVPLLALCKVLDGANVNLKSYSDELYRRLNGGRLDPVLRTFEILHKNKVHFEITNLVVPSYNDDEELVKKMCHWILKTVGPDYPLHFLRFFPQYKLDRLSPTPVSTLEKFRKIAMGEGVRYVYLGNVPKHEGNNTYCHHCKNLLVERRGYDVSIHGLSMGRCGACDTLIPGVWM